MLVALAIAYHHNKLETDHRALLLMLIDLLHVFSIIHNSIKTYE